MCASQGIFSESARALGGFSRTTARTLGPPSGLRARHCARLKGILSDSVRAPGESSRTQCAPQGNPLGLCARLRGTFPDQQGQGPPGCARIFATPALPRTTLVNTSRCHHVPILSNGWPHHVPICAHHPLPHHVPNCARRAPPRTDPSPVHHVPIWTRHVPIWTHHVPIWVRFGPTTYRFGPHEASPRTNVEPVPGRPRTDFCAVGNTTYQCGPHLTPPRAVFVRNLAETTPLFKPQRTAKHVWVCL